MKKFAIILKMTSVHYKYDKATDMHWPVLDAAGVPKVHNDGYHVYEYDFLDAAITNLARHAADYSNKPEFWTCTSATPTRMTFVEKATSDGISGKRLCSRELVISEIVV